MGIAICNLENRLENVVAWAEVEVHSVMVHGTDSISVYKAVSLFLVETSQTYEVLTFPRT